MAETGWRPGPVGDILFTVESEKAVQEVEALESGTLCVVPNSPPPGTEMPVGTPLASLLKRGEEMPAGGPGPAARAAEPPWPSNDERVTRAPSSSQSRFAHPRLLALGETTKWLSVPARGA